MDRNLIDYLPPCTQELKEIEKIMEAEQAEISQTWDDNTSVLENQFINDTNLEGLKRWEKLYGISSKPTDSLSDRRFRLLAKTTEQLPYTTNKLTQQLEALCGADNYYWELDHRQLILHVRVALKAKNNFDDVDKLLERMIPVNIMIDLSLLYNQHLTLSKCTYKQLAQYTQKQIRNEVLN